MIFKNTSKAIGKFFSINSHIRYYRAVCAAKKILSQGYYEEQCKKASIPLRKGENLWKHYKKFGVPLNIDPCEFFMSDWYTRQYLKNVKNKNPLIHFLCMGERRNLQTSPLFNINNIKNIYINEWNNIGSFFVFLTLNKNFSKLKNTYNNILFNNNLTHYDNNFITIGSELIYSKKYFEKNNIEYKEIDCKKISTYEEVLFPLQPFYGIITNAVLITSTFSILTKENTLINDEIYFYIKNNDQYGNTYKSPEKNYIYKNKLYINNIRDVHSIKNGIVFSKEYDSNYFHFLTELAIKINYIDDNDIFPKNMPILINKNMHKNILRLIEIINTKNRKIIELDTHSAYHVDKLAYLSDFSLIEDSTGKKPTNNSTVIPISQLINLRKKIFRQLKIGNRKPLRRLFISRNSNMRMLVNQSEVIKLLYDFGFENISVEELTFDEQVDIFSQAEFIIGPTGAAMTNLLWCPPKTKVIIFYPDHILNNHTFWDIFAKAIGFDIQYFFGKITDNKSNKENVHVNYKIDIPKLRDFLKFYNLK